MVPEVAPMGSHVKVLAWRPVERIADVRSARKRAFNGGYPGLKVGKFIGGWPNVGERLFCWMFLLSIKL
jgi:hypothetical protein